MTPRQEGAVIVGVGSLIAIGSYLLMSRTGGTIENPEGMACKSNADCGNPNYGCSNGKCTVQGP